MVDLVIMFFAQYAYLVVVSIAIWFFISSVLSIRTSILVVGTLSSTIAFVADKILNKFIESPRPFVVEHITPLFPHVANNGFPSEHTLFATVIASVLFVYNKKVGTLLFLLAFCIGVARVLANVHHLIDIIGGIAIGVISVYIVYCFRKLV